MTIAATASEISYAGNGVSLVFPIPFPFDTSADLKVIQTDSSGNPVVLSSGFSTGGGGGSTGTLTMVTAPPAGSTLTILDDPDLTQTADYTDNDAFPAATHEGALDRGVRISKRLYQLLLKCIRVDDGDPSAGSGMLLGSVQARKGKYLFFNAVTGAVEYAAAVIGSTLSRSIIGQFFYPQTSAESSHGVAPANYAYESAAIGGFANILRQYTAGAADTAAQSIIDTLVGGVRFPPGTYQFDTLFDWTDLGNNTFIIEGSGDSSVIQFASASDGWLITTDQPGDDDHVFRVVRQLKFQGVGTPTEGSGQGVGLRLGNTDGGANGANSVTLDHLKFSGFETAVLLNQCITTELNHVRFRDNDYGVYSNALVEDDTPNDVHLNYCYFIRSDVAGLWLEGYVKANFVLTGCTFESNFGRAVYVRNINSSVRTKTNLTFNDCWFEQNHLNNQDEANFDIDIDGCNTIFRGGRVTNTQAGVAWTARYSFGSGKTTFDGTVIDSISSDQTAQFKSTGTIVFRNMDLFFEGTPSRPNNFVFTGGVVVFECCNINYLKLATTERENPSDSMVIFGAGNTYNVFSVSGLNSFVGMDARIPLQAHTLAYPVNLNSDLSFESGVGTVVARPTNAPTVSQSTDQALKGSNSCKIVYTSGAGDVDNNAARLVAQHAVNDGQFVAISFAIRGTAGAKIKVQQYEVGGTNHLARTEVTLTSSWRRYVMLAQNNTGSNQATTELQMYPTASGGPTVYIDLLMVVIADSAHDIQGVLAGGVN